MSVIPVSDKTRKVNAIVDELALLSEALEDAYHRRSTSAARLLRGYINGTGVLNLEYTADWDELLWEAEHPEEPGYDEEEVDRKIDERKMGDDYV